VLDLASCRGRLQAWCRDKPVTSLPSRNTDGLVGRRTVDFSATHTINLRLGEGGHMSPHDLIEDKRGIRDPESSVGETSHVMGHLVIRSRRVKGFPRVSPLGVPLGIS
jgi:hypothetical protein